MKYCHVDDFNKFIVDQSLYSRILNQIPRHCIETDEVRVDDGFQISRSDLHIHSILLSLEHAKLSNASTPCSSINGVTHQLVDFPVDKDSKKSIKLPSPMKSMSTCTYSSLQLLTKAGVFKALHTLQETHPYTEIFYHALSQCAVLVVHTGYDGRRTYKFNESTQCHTNVGFHNFLKYLHKPICPGVMSGSLEESHTDDCERNDHCSQHSTDESYLTDHAAITQTGTIVGYNMGDSLLHLQSSRLTCFTSDGIQVHVDKHGFVESSVFIGVSLLTPDGHKISCVKYDHFESELEEQCNVANDDPYINQPTKGLQHMSLYVSLNNGMKIATSYYGPNGNGCLVNMPVVSRRQHHQNAVGELELSQCTKMEVHNTEKQCKAELEYQILTSHNQYQHLFATTSYGLKTHVHIFSPLTPNVSSTNEGRKILVKQERYKTTKRFSLPIDSEIYRYYLPGGLLICVMDNQSLVIHCADGSIYHTATACEYDNYSRRSLQLSGDHSHFKEIQSQIRSISETVGVKTEQYWVVTLPAGQQFLYKQKHLNDSQETKEDSSNLLMPLEDIPCSITTDPVTKQVSYLTTPHIYYNFLLLKIRRFTHSLLVILK